MSDENNHNAIKLISAILVIIAAGGWTFHRARQAQPGAVANNGVSDEFQRPTPQEMKKSFEQAAAYAALSTTQTQKLEELQAKMQGMWEGRRGGFGRRDEMTTAQREQMHEQFQTMRQQAQDLRQQYDQVMTGEQRNKFRAAMSEQRSKRETKLKAALSEQDYQRYQDRRRSRFGGRGGRGGRGGGGRGGGGGQRGDRPGSGNTNPRPQEV